MTTKTTFLSPVQSLLSQVDRQMRAQTEGSHPDLAAAMQHLIDAGGKRVRPSLSLLVGQMLGAQAEHIVSLAAAVELLHTATLVHDDLIDGALLRRGMPTLNTNWTPAATVLTGDFVFARAADLAASTDSIAVMKMFAETLSTIVNGEIRQYFSSRGLASREDYFTRIYAKTASMFELASGAAALLSPVQEDIQQAACQFGYELGMAFQIMDDVLDFTGAQATVGKPVGSDLRQGLITLPALYYHEAHPEDPAMESVIQRNGHNNRQMDALVEAIRDSGAVQQSVSEARAFIGRAQRLLSRMPASVEREALVDLSNYIIDREI